MRKLKDYILLFLKGVGMGGADVVPGVSGGTIAFITGIYEELLDSIKSINLTTLKLLAKGEFAEFWRAINGNFLLVLFSGILVSIKSLASLMTYLMEYNPIQLWSFFLGLILISSLVVARQIQRRTPVVILFGILGIVIAYLITTLSPAVTSDSLIMVFFSGLLAISAMILPGISGSFILLILGKYKMIITALSDLNFVVLGVFAMGCIVGLLSLSRVISYLLKKYHDITIALLAGFMIGSLNKIWPWKEVIEYRVNRHGEQVPFIERNILPNEYLELTGQDPLVIQAILYLALGFSLVLIMEKIALTVSRRSSK